MAIRLTKEQLRRIIRETVRQKLDRLDESYLPIDDDIKEAQVPEEDEE